MTAFVALLRGVNVGKAKRVPMGAFRAVLTQLGYEDVATLLNSGNAVFRAHRGAPAAHAAAIASALRHDLDFEVPVVVVSMNGLATAVAECPFATEATDPSRLLVAFAQDREALSSLASLATLVAGREKFALGSQAAYLWCPEGILESRAAKTLLGKAGRPVTTRNWSTVLKLSELARDRAE